MSFSSYSYHNRSLVKYSTLTPAVFLTKLTLLHHITLRFRLHLIIEVYFVSCMMWSPPAAVLRGGRRRFRYLTTLYCPVTCLVFCYSFVSNFKQRKICDRTNIYWTRCMQFWVWVDSEVEDVLVCRFAGRRTVNFFFVKAIKLIKFQNITRFKKSNKFI